MFLEISQNSQEHTCARVSFLIKLHAWACNFIKKETLAQAFSIEFCEISISTYFTEHLRVTASFSLLGSLLFNIFPHDMFCFISNTHLRMYADDNTLYILGENIDKLNLLLQSNFSILERWFYENPMILNPGKCHYTLLGG